MKKILVLIMLLIGFATIYAQNNIIGKWKLISLEDTKLGKVDVANEVAFNKQYWDGVTEEAKKDGKVFTKEDSTFLEENLKEISYQMNNYCINFNTNKTYIGQLGNEKTTGVYIYNAALKKLGKKETGKPKYKYSKVYIENGQMIVDIPEQNMKLYFDRVK